jgi:hypothetical protein
MSRKSRKADRKNKLEKQLCGNSKKVKYRRMKEEGILGDNERSTYEAMLIELGQIGVNIQGNFINYSDMEKGKNPKKKDYQNLRIYYCQKMAEYRETEDRKAMFRKII